MCWSTWPVKWVSQSLWSLRGVPQVGIIFSKRTLATEEAVACLQGKASVQCENIQTNIFTYLHKHKTYLHPWNTGSCMKSICQNLNGPLGNLKCPGAVWTVSLGCILSGTSEAGTFCSLIYVSPLVLIHEGRHFVSRPVVECMHSGEEWEF